MAMRFRGWQGRVLRAALPRCFPATSCFRAESAHIPASGARPPQQALPGCPAQPPACFVCFLSHFAKYLLIFSTKSQRLPRGARVSTHYSRKCIQLPGLTNNPTTNRKGHTNKHQQQVATLLLPHESSSTIRDQGTHATLQPPGWHSTALTTSRGVS